MLKLINNTFNIKQSYEGQTIQRRSHSISTVVHCQGSGRDSHRRAAKRKAFGSCPLMDIEK
jgi:hypothetical protein